MISKIYAEFDAVWGTQARYVAEHWERLQLSAGERDAVRDGAADWADAYSKYINPATHSAPVIAHIATLHKRLKTFSLEIRAQLKTDQRITLTAQDRVVFNIHDRKPKSPQPRIDFAPNIVRVEPKAGSVKFTVNNPPDRRGRPMGQMPQHGATIGIAVAYSDDSTAPPRNAYREHDASSRMRFTVTVANADRKKFGYLIAWFTNTTGKSGPECAPVEFVAM